MTPPQALGKPALPFIRSGKNTAQIYWGWVLALVPSLATGVYVFGWNVLLSCAAAILSALVCELLSVYFLNNPYGISNGHSFFMAILLAILLAPFTSPAVTGRVVFLALFFGKHIFGGEGGYLFNPAAAGILLAGIFENFNGSRPFPADAAKILAFDAAAILSGLAVLGQRNIRWQTPFYYMGTAFLALGLLKPSVISGFVPAYLFLFSLFVLLEFGTVPTTKQGAKYFGAGAGILTFMVIDGIHFLTALASVTLIMNGVTPWIDDWTRPRGSRIRWAESKLKS